MTVGDQDALAYIDMVMSKHDEAETIGGTPRAAKRPAHVKPPAGWTNTPVPAPEPARAEPDAEQPGGRNPVRYGDWELKGLAIDF